MKRYMFPSLDVGTIVIDQDEHGNLFRWDVDKNIRYELNALPEGSWEKIFSNAVEVERSTCPPLHEGNIDKEFDRVMNHIKDSQKPDILVTTETCQEKRELFGKCISVLTDRLKTLAKNITIGMVFIAVGIILMTVGFDARCDKIQKKLEAEQKKTQFLKTQQESLVSGMDYVYKTSQTFFENFIANAKAVEESKNAKTEESKARKAR